MSGDDSGGACDADTDHRDRSRLLRSMRDFQVPIHLVDDHVHGFSPHTMVKSPTFHILVRRFDEILGPWEYHGCHEIEEMIANDSIESSVGGM